MLASMKRQFVELLSDIGFTKEGLTVRALERLTRDGGDGVIEASGYEVRLLIHKNFLLINFAKITVYLSDISGLTTICYLVL